MLEMREKEFEKELNDAWQNYQYPNKNKFQIYVLDNHRPFHLTNVTSDLVSLLQNSNDTDLSKYPIYSFENDDRNIDNIRQMEAVQYLNDNDDSNSDDEKQVQWYGVAHFIFRGFFFFRIIFFCCFFVLFLFFCC